MNAKRWFVCWFLDCMKIKNHFVKKGDYPDIKVELGILIYFTFTVFWKLSVSENL